MGKEFSTTPRAVPRVETKSRRIVTPLPHPDSLPTLEKSRQFEPQSLRGQPPPVWARADGLRVGGKQKIGIVGYGRGFRGRTLRAQQSGGMAAQKSWIVNLDLAI